MGKDLKGKDLGIGIRQLKNGQYNARFTTKGGLRKEKSFDKLQEARRWLVTARTEDDARKAIDGETITVRQWFKQWMNTFMRHRIEPTTFHDYELRYGKVIDPCIGSMILGNVKAYHCQGIINGMIEEGKNPTYIRNVACIIRMMFLSAVENDLIQKSPFVSTITIPKQTRTNTSYLTVDMIEKFLEAISEKCSYTIQFKLILETGLRYEELAALTEDSIDLKNNVINVTSGMHYTKEMGYYIGRVKSVSSSRTIPMSKTARELIEDAIHKRRTRVSPDNGWNDLLFVNSNGMPISNSTYDIALARIAERRMHVDKFSMHDLRRTFSTMCYEAGCRDKDISTLMGHATTSTTQKFYIKTGLKNSVEAIERMSAFKKSGGKVAETIA